jgi:hypothetical protein
MGNDTDLSGITVTLIVVVLVACVVGAWIIDRKVGLVASVGAAIVGLYLAYRWIQSEETGVGS